MEIVMYRLLTITWQVAIVILAILLVRGIFIVTKVPKKYISLLWLIPFVRLLLPITIPNPLSLITSENTKVTQEAVIRVVKNVENTIGIGSGKGSHVIISDALVTPMASVNPIQLLMFAAGIIWILGMLVLVMYSIVSYLKLRKKLSICLKIQDDVYLVDDLKSPFVIGIFHKRIYLPSCIKDNELPYVLAHERRHIKNGDTIIKPLVFLLTCIHWFNPFVWAAFSLLGKDMEMACDEAVLLGMGMQHRSAYATTLLEFSTAGNRKFAVPLAFSEGDVKKRLKQIMKVKKPKFFASIIAIVTIVCLTGCLATTNETKRKIESGNTDSVDPKVEIEVIENKGQQQITLDTPTIAKDMPLGADGPSLDYVDEKRIIFHDYFGLFVYDLATQKMSRAIPLEQIGCQYTQGDSACEVRVTNDGATIYLHPLNQDTMYQYEIDNDLLLETEGDLAKLDLFDEGIYKTNAINSRNGANVASALNDMVSQQYYSYESGGETYYRYLTANDGTVGTLAYVDDDMVYDLFGQYLKDDVMNGADSSSYTMSIVEDTVSTTGLTLEFTTDLEEGFFFEEGYRIQKLVGKSYVDVPYIIGDWGFHDIAHVVDKEKPSSQTIDWKWIYGELDPGCYVIHKSGYVIEQSENTRQIGFLAFFIVS